MAGTLLSVRDRVRWLINDRNQSEYVISSPRLDRLIADRLNHIAELVGYGLEWATAAVTLAANTFDYSLPSSIQYHQIVDVVLNSRGWQLVRRGIEELNALRGVATPATGDPTDYALFEGLTQLVTIRLYPTPASADTLNLLRSRIPIAVSADADVVSFSDNLLRALEKDVALNVLALLGDEELKQLGVSRNVIPLWSRDLERAIKAERVRIRRMKLTDRYELSRA
jgi:hypothetical protein